MDGFFDTLISGGYNQQIGDILGGAGSYYLGQENIEGAKASGERALTLGQQAGQQAQEASAFKPYAVTSGLANINTTPEGGFDIQLSPQQQALQQQLMGQAGSLFGQVGQDPAAQQAAIYEQIRATQRPEEERKRLAMQEGLFASGRGGLQTAQYGGSPEQFAYEKARQEAMFGASLGAREQALAEQKQALSSAEGLLTAGYQPQEQALGLLEASQVPAGYTAAGQRTGAELGSKLGAAGLEGFIQGEDLANRLQLQQLQGLQNLLTGQQVSPLEQAQIAKIYGDMGEDVPGMGGVLQGFLESVFNPGGTA
jgi:hypothetical protein